MTTEMHLQEGVPRERNRSDAQSTLHEAIETTHNGSPSTEGAGSGVPEGLSALARPPVARTLPEKNAFSSTLYKNDHAGGGHLWSRSRHTGREEEPR